MNSLRIDTGLANDKPFLGVGGYGFDAYIAKLFDEYHEIEHQIHRINMGSELANDTFVHELKAKLLFMKDDIYSYLNK